MPECCFKEITLSSLAAGEKTIPNIMNGAAGNRASQVKTVVLTSNKKVLPYEKTEYEKAKQSKLSSDEVSQLLVITNYRATVKASWDSRDAELIVLQHM